MRFLYVLLAALLLPAAAQAQCTISWLVPVDGRWDDPNNWDASRVPGPSDVVCITDAGDYTVQLISTAEIQSLRLGGGTLGAMPQQTLQIGPSGGRLTLAGAESRVFGAGVLVLDAGSEFTSRGVLDGPGDVVVEGTFVWEGDLHGTGAFTVEGEARLGGPGGRPRLFGRTVTNTGSTVMGDRYGLILRDGAAFDNRGLFEWEAGDTSTRAFFDETDDSRILNSGTMRFLGDQPIETYAIFENTGTVEAAAGTVTFREASAHIGATLHTEPGATIRFGKEFTPRTHTLVNATATGTGTISVYDQAILDVQTDLSIPGTLNVESSDITTVQGAGTITTVDMTWQRGTLTGSGLVVVTGTLLTTNSVLILDGRTLRLEGTADGAGVRFRNGGVFQVAPGASYTFDTAILALDDTGRIENEGTITTGGRLPIEATVENRGTLELLGNGGGELWDQNVPMACAGGEIVVGDGALFRLFDGVSRFDGCTLRGPGEVRVRNSSTLVVDGGGAEIVDGGRLFVSQFGPATLLGSGPVTVTDGAFENNGAFLPGPTADAIETTTFAAAGPFVLGRNSILTVDLVSGTTPGTEHDQLAIDGPGTIANDLVVRIADGYTPALGDQFVVATCTGGCTGTFDRIDTPDGFRFDVDYGADDVTLTVTATPVASEDVQPTDLVLDALTPGFPNPFTSVATLTLAIGEAQDVTVAVYDLLGREVARLHDGPLAPHEAHAFRLDGQAWAPGVYLVRAAGATFTSVHRLTRAR